MRRAYRISIICFLIALLVYVGLIFYSINIRKAMVNSVQNILLNTNIDCNYDIETPFSITWWKLQTHIKNIDIVLSDTSKNSIDNTKYRCFIPKLDLTYDIFNGEGKIRAVGHDNDNFKIDCSMRARSSYNNNKQFLKNPSNKSNSNRGSDEMHFQIYFVGEMLIYITQEGYYDRHNYSLKQHIANILKPYSENSLKSVNTKMPAVIFSTNQNKLVDIASIGEGSEIRFYVNNIVDLMQTKIAFYRQKIAEELSQDDKDWSEKTKRAQNTILQNRLTKKGLNKKMHEYHTYYNLKVSLKDFRVHDLQATCNDIAEFARNTRSTFYNQLIEKLGDISKVAENFTGTDKSQGIDIYYKFRHHYLNLDKLDTQLENITTPFFKMYDIKQLQDWYKAKDPMLGEQKFLSLCMDNTKYGSILLANQQFLYNNNNYIADDVYLEVGDYHSLILENTKILADKVDKLPQLNTLLKYLEEGKLKKLVDALSMVNLKQYDTTLKDKASLHPLAIFLYNNPNGMFINNNVDAKKFFHEQLAPIFLSESEKSNILIQVK